MTGNEIREARERAGLTQDALGSAVGVSGRTVGNWERGTTVPRNRLAKLREVLEMTTTPADATPLRDVSDASLLAEIARRFDAGRTREEAGEGDASTPLTRAGVSPAPEDDGLGSFGGRARGDLDHESINDGAGDNVHRIRSVGNEVRSPASGGRESYRRPSDGKFESIKSTQSKADETSIEEILEHAAYEPTDDGERD